MTNKPKSRDEIVKQIQRKHLILTPKGEEIQIDLSKRLVDLKKEMLEKIKGKIDGLEVALTIASGNGKEHMALCSALLSIPTGIRFTALTRDGIIYL